MTEPPSARPLHGQRDSSGSSTGTLSAHRRIRSGRCWLPELQRPLCGCGVAHHADLGGRGDRRALHARNVRGGHERRRKAAKGVRGQTFSTSSASLGGQAKGERRSAPNNGNKGQHDYVCERGSNRTVRWRPQPGGGRGVRGAVPVRQSEMHAARRTSQASTLYMSAVEIVG